MKSVIPRPALLALILLLVIGAIALIELRLDAASSDEAQATADPQPAGRQEQSGTDAANQTGEAKSSAAVDRGMVREQPRAEIAARVERKETEFRRAEEIVNPSGFINTDGVSISEARGEKVVLLDFWTYSCYNCQNTQPFINRWHDKYADDGLQVIGVHTPEFGFEREYANVEQAVREAGIEYPVVLDNSYATWNAYDQRYWPAWYLIDADGFVRYEHFGEGAYGETEAKIRELLAERDRIGNRSGLTGRQR